jgi:MFS family permease
MAALIVLAFRRIWERYSHITVLICGYTLLATGYYFTAKAGSISQVFLGMAISGSGFAVVIPTFTVWIFDIAPKKYRGRAVGGVTMSVFLGTGLSPIYSQPIADWIGLSGAFYVSGIIQASFILCFALIGLKNFFIYEGYRK